MRHMVRRLLATYASANGNQIALGSSWYGAARKVVCELAARYNAQPDAVAGIIAALSPRVTWRRNIRLASDVLGNCYQRGAFKANLTKAMRIDSGERPLDVLRGDKVRAFYLALMGDESSVVVDVWMLRAVKHVKGITSKTYGVIAAAIREAASVVGATAASFQAIVWTVVRGSAT